MAEIYPPAEDSFFLAGFVKNCVAKNKSGAGSPKILDMGSGSGIQAEAAISAGIKPENTTLVDKNTSAIKHLKQKFPLSNIVNSDLFSKVKGKFDLIIFNPPYLPKNKFDSEIDTAGGKRGSETINEFLRRAKSHLEKSGKILLLASSFTKGIKWSGYKKILLGKKKLFFEELYVWEIRKN